jgi:ElaB/YqjD/DUF883 family membrane-anchored ribosome-binding protein
MPENERYDALRGDVNKLRDDLSSIAETLKGIAGSEGSALQERLRRAAQETRGEGERLARAAKQQVEEKPITSIGISFVVGLLLGLLFSRR